MVLAVKTTIQKTKGFYLLPALTAVSLIVLILSPKNGFAWGIFGLFTFRIIKMTIRPLTWCTFVILTVTGALTLFHTFTCL